MSKSKMIRKIRHERVRKKVSGTAERPRLSVHFSQRHIQLQIIDDLKGRTLVSVATTEKSLKDKAKANVAIAMEVASILAERAQAKGITKVVFDRGGNHYHGKIKALADTARAAGLIF